MNTKILVCCHKKDVMLSNEVYMPIHVGKALHPDVDLGIQVDNEGDNISDKNSSYCELTGLYWAWKNLKDVDVIGLCHYRRYFDFHGQCKFGSIFDSFNTDELDSLDFSIPENILKDVVNGACVVAKPRVYKYSIAVDYCYEHVSDDLRLLKNIILEEQPENIKHAFRKVFWENNELFHYNMFLMKKSEFDDYCSWLFSILKKVEDGADRSHYNAMQGRIYGYIGERLLNVWLLARNLKKIEKPIIWFNNAPRESLKSILNYRLQCCIKKFTFFIANQSVKKLPVDKL